MLFENVVLVARGTLSALLAGLLFIFSNTIVPSLRAMSARAHVEAGQILNRKILNPVFMVVFIGPSILLPLGAFLVRGGAAFPYVLAAAVLQVIGVFGVTGGGNVPLNNQLDKVDLSHISEAEAERVRNDYQGVGASWMTLNNIRVVASTLAAILIFIACLVKAR